MQKNNNIRWRHKDQTKLSNYVRKFNTKITKLTNQVPMLADFLPKKLNVKELRGSIETRKDLNELFKSVDNFFKPGATNTIVNKEGIKTTVYYKKEIERKVRRINARRKQELKEMNPTTEKGTMGSIRENNLRPKEFNFDTMRKDNWESFVRSVEKQSKFSYYNKRYELYKENYLKAFDDSFGNAFSGLRQFITKMDSKTLSDLLYDNPVLSITFYYGPEEMMSKGSYIVDAMAKQFNIEPEDLLDESDVDYYNSFWDEDGDFEEVY